MVPFGCDVKTVLQSLVKCATTIALLTRLLTDYIAALPGVMHCVLWEVRQWPGDLTEGEWAEC